MQSSFQGFPSPRPNKGGTNTGDATATADDIQTGLTAYVAGLKLTGTSTRKKWASGSTLEALDGASIYHLTVSGLSFTPKFILAGANTSSIMMYNANLSTTQSFDGVLGTYVNRTIGAAGSPVTYVTAGGFKLQRGGWQGGSSIPWIAFE